jgi:glycosyltransferase involved in cell wall biosynthesis
MSPWSPRVLVVPASTFARQRTLGGGERYAQEYVRALQHATPTAQGLFDLRARAAAPEGGIPIERIPVRHFSLRRGVGLMRGTFTALDPYEVLHLMCFPTPFSEFLAVWGRWKRKLVVLTDVGGGGWCWSAYLKKLNDRWDAHRMAHGLAHLSKYAAGFFTDWGQPQTVLFGGADTFPPPAESETRPGGYALFVGRLLPHKGVLELIRSVGPATPLRVVGRPYAPEYFEQLKREADGKRVEFFTNASDAEMRRHVAEASVVLQPSIPAPGAGGDKSELLGLVALEGMAAGKPAIVTSITSLPELVVDGETGYVVAPHDLTSLGRRVEALVSDPELSVRLGRKARARVEAEFTWAATAARGLDFYRRLGGRNRSRM